MPQSRDEIDLSMTERAISVALGLTLAAAAAQPRPNKVLSLLALAAGSALAIRGATGRSLIGPVLANTRRYLR